MASARQQMELELQTQLAAGKASIGVSRELSTIMQVAITQQSPLWGVCFVKRSTLEIPSGLARNGGASVRDRGRTDARA